MAAILAGWYSRVLSPCASPTRIWIGVMTSRIHSPIEKLTLTPRSRRPWSRCQAPQAATMKPATMNAAIVMCASRYGNDGLKMTSSQSTGTMMPLSSA